MLLGLTFCVRFQLAPAIALVGVWIARTDLRRGWLPLVAGGAIPLAISGALDYATLGTPFQSLWKNFYINIVEDRASHYGTMASYHYVKELARFWGSSAALLAIFFFIGARKLPLLAGLAAIIILSHSLIAHKEISFIYAAIPPFLIVSGVGLAEVFLALAPLASPRLHPRALLAAVAGFWVMASALTGISGYEMSLRRGANHIRAAEAVRSKPDLCGLGLFGHPFPWYLTGGYAHLNRPVPIHSVNTPEAAIGAHAGFNYLMADHTLVQSLPGYERVGCWDGLCVLRHGRGCTSTPATEINRVLTETRQ